MKKSQPLFTIEEIPGKGKCLVASQDIQRGTRILREKPIFVIQFLNYEEFSMPMLESRIRDGLRDCSKEEQRDFFSLRNNFSKKHPLHGIFKTNALITQESSDGSDYGMFLIAALANNSCAANACYNWNIDTHSLTIHATKRIPQGHEISIPYLPNDWSVLSVRRTMLETQFGFQCSCEFCSLSERDRAASDLRRREIQKLSEAVGNEEKVKTEPLECLLRGRRLLRLLTLEEISDSSVAVAYFNLFKAVVTHGDMARGVVFARKAYEHRVICEGVDSLVSKELKGFVISPESHPLCGTFSNEMKSGVDEVPKYPEEVDKYGFDAWLWHQ